MRRVAMLLWMATLSLGARAQETIGPAGVRNGTMIEVDPAACRQATGQAPPPGPDYTEGVDSERNAVVPADIPGSQKIKPAQHFFIPLSFDLARRLNLPLSFEQKAYVGLIEVDKGRLYFNGVPLDSDAEAALAPLCPGEATAGQ